MHLYCSLPFATLGREESTTRKKREECAAEMDDVSGAVTSTLGTVSGGKVKLKFEIQNPKLLPCSCLDHGARSRYQ